MSISVKRKEYLLKNREHIKEYNKKYAQLEKEKERKRKWIIDNPEHCKKYYEKNKEVLLEKAKEYHLKNKEKRNKQSMKWKKEHPNYEKDYRKKHRKELSARQKLWDREKIRTDMKYNINHRIRNDIRRSLKGNKNGRHWEELVGYSLDVLMNRLLQTIPKGYCWQNFLDGELHIDHIIPKNAFNYTNPEHPDFRQCWALSNLRLLLAKKNLTKGSKLTKPFQPALKISIM